MKLRIACLSLASAALLALGHAAWAVDLSGVYDGKLKCKGLDAAGMPAKTGNQPSTIQIGQSGQDLLLSLDGNTFEGTVLNEAGNPDLEGIAIAEACHNDGDPNGRIETLQLDVNVAKGSSRTTVKLTSVRGTDGALVCTGTFKRTQTGSPKMASCPVFYSCVCSGTGGGAGACGNGGAGGDPGNVVSDIDQATLDSLYVNGNDTGWVCVPE